MEPSDYAQMLMEKNFLSEYDVDGGRKALQELYDNQDFKDVLRLDGIEEKDVILLSYYDKNIGRVGYIYISRDDMDLDNAISEVKKAIAVHSEID